VKDQSAAPGHCPRPATPPCRVPELRTPASRMSLVRKRVLLFVVQSVLNLTVFHCCQDQLTCWIHVTYCSRRTLTARLVSFYYVNKETNRDRTSLKQRLCFVYFRLRTVDGSVTRTQAGYQARDEASLPIRGSALRRTMSKVAARSRTICTKFAQSASSLESQAQQRRGYRQVTSVGDLRGCPNNAVEERS